MILYDAVLIGTGPSRAIDQKRTVDALEEIKRVYGGIEKYKGLWLVAGTLGEQDPETSQRAGIKNRLLEGKVSPEQIVIVEGEDTVDKTRHTITLARERNLRNVGISDYWLHYQRYVLALNYAKKEKIAPDELKFLFINSPTTLWLRRLTIDKVYGIFGIIKEDSRLRKYGFAGSTPDKKVLGSLVDGAKDLTSGD